MRSGIALATGAALIVVLSQCGASSDLSGASSCQDWEAASSDAKDAYVSDSLKDAPSGPFSDAEVEFAAEEVSATCGAAQAAAMQAGSLEDLVGLTVRAIESCRSVRVGGCP